jgi:hypothetical protein
LFVLGARGSGGAVPASGDLPFSLRRDLGPVDRAEVVSLLHALEGEEPAGTLPDDPAARGLLASDLLWLAARFEALREAGAGPMTAARSPDGAQAPDGGSIDPSIPLLSRAARSFAAQGRPASASLPPPLRDGGWTEIEGPPAPGLRPSLADLRWTRVFRGGGERPATALVRLRVGVGADGGPLLLPLGSEAWVLAPGADGRTAGRAFRFRRTKLIRGEEPWEEVAAEEEIAVIDPRDPGKDPPRGKVAALCSGCHPKEVDSEARPKISDDPDRAAKTQVDDARQALEALFSKGR